MKTEDMNTLYEAALTEEQEEPIVKKSRRTPAEKGSKGSRKLKTGKAVNSKFVRIRKGASGNSQVVAVINLGDRAEIIDRVPGYYQIKTEKEGYIGFVSSNYFEED